MIILNTQVTTDFAEIVDFSNAATDCKVVDGFQVDFEVEVTNKSGETKAFHIIFLSEDRNEQLKAYSGFEMKCGVFYGCDTDESNKLDEFMSYEQDVIASLCDIAEKECKAFLN